MSMDNKIPSVGENNANEIFKFYTLHQREVERTLKMSVYAAEQEPLRDSLQRHSSMPNIRERQSSTESKGDPITVGNMSVLWKTRGQKVLDRMAKACEFHRPPDFEYWDFGYQSRKSMKKSSRQFLSTNFGKIVESVRSLTKKASEMSKIPKGTILISTFHENYRNLAKGSFVTKSHKDNESTDIKAETTYGNIFGNRRNSEFSQKPASFKVDRKSVVGNKAILRETGSEKSTGGIPLLTSTDFAKGVKVKIPSKDHRYKEEIELSTGFDRVQFLRKHRASQKPEKGGKVIVHPELMSKLKPHATHE
jgi:hypothetical protein